MSVVPCAAMVCAQSRGRQVRGSETVPSRDKKARTAAPAVAGPPVGSPASAAGVPGAPSAPGAGPDNAGQAEAPRSNAVTWRSLKNWRVRSRLLLLIIIPTLTAVVLGGSRIVTSVQSALAYQRVEQLASTSYDVTGLAARLEDERDQTLQYIGCRFCRPAGMLKHNTQNGAPENLQLVQQDQKLTSPWVQKVRADAAGIGAGYPGQVQTDAHNIPDLLRLLPPLRTAATSTQLPATEILSQYRSMITQLLAIDDNIALDSGDPALNNDVRALNLVSLIAEEASQQRGLLSYAFAQEGLFDPAGAERRDEGARRGKRQHRAVRPSRHAATGSPLQRLGERQPRRLRQQLRAPGHPVRPGRQVAQQPGYDGQ